MMHKKARKQFSEDKQTKDMDYWNHDARINGALNLNRGAIAICHVTFKSVKMELIVCISW